MKDNPDSLIRRIRNGLQEVGRTISRALDGFARNPNSRAAREHLCNAEQLHAEVCDNFKLLLEDLGWPHASPVADTRTVTRSKLKIEKAHTAFGKFGASKLTVNWKTEPRPGADVTIDGVGPLHLSPKLAVLLILTSAHIDVGSGPHGHLVGYKPYELIADVMERIFGKRPKKHAIDNLICRLRKKLVNPFWLATEEETGRLRFCLRRDAERQIMGLGNYP